MSLYKRHLAKATESEVPIELDKTFPPKTGEETTLPIDDEKYMAELSKKMDKLLAKKKTPSEIEYENSLKNMMDMFAKVNERIAEINENFKKLVADNVDDEEEKEETGSGIEDLEKLADEMEAKEMEERDAKRAAEEAAEKNKK